MHHINVNLSEEEIAKLIQQEQDQERKAQLLQLLSGDIVKVVTIESVNIPGGEMGRVSYLINYLKSGAVVSTERKYATLSLGEILQIAELIKTFGSVTNNV